MQSTQVVTLKSGQQNASSIVQMAVRKAFKPERCWPGKKLTLENTAGELIDQLMGICFAQPPYLRKADAMRYVSLLNELKAFECPALSPQGNHKTPSKRHSDTTFADRAGIVDQFSFCRGTPSNDASVRAEYRSAD